MKNIITLVGDGRLSEVHGYYLLVDLVVKKQHADKVLKRECDLKKEIEIEKTIRYNLLKNYLIDNYIADFEHKNILLLDELKRGNVVVGYKNINEIRDIRFFLRKESADKFFVDLRLGFIRASFGGTCTFSSETRNENQLYTVTIKYKKTDPLYINGIKNEMYVDDMIKVYSTEVIVDVDEIEKSFIAFRAEFTKAVNSGIINLMSEYLDSS